VDIGRYIHENLDLALGVDPSTVFGATLGSTFADFLALYCDASSLSAPKSSASGVYIPSQKRAFSWCLHPYCTVLTTELTALYHSLVIIQQSNHPNWVSCTDS
jgi:hypothetical protein